MSQVLKKFSSIGSEYTFGIVNVYEQGENEENLRMGSCGDMQRRGHTYKVYKGLIRVLIRLEERVRMKRRLQ